MMLILIKIKITKIEFFNQVLIQLILRGRIKSNQTQIVHIRLRGPQLL
jgi:hypothetical protein